MRRLSVMLVAAAVLATAASAATVDARLLVLRRADVPPGFGVDHDSSRYWPNAAVARSSPQVRKLLTSSGRSSGYTATYEKGTAAIVSAAHLFREGDGAHVFYSAEDAQQRAVNADRIKRGGRAYRRESVGLGDEASLYRSKETPKFTLLLWRTGRVVGSVSTWGLGRDRTVALARVQQRRIADALG
jgi:hypothetical protein